MIEIFGTELFQWDTGRSVKVTEIEADHVHFANKGDSKAVIMDIADSLAKIPDYLLQTGKQLCVYAVKNGVTVESKIIYVKNRERPESYVYEEDQRNYIYALITNAEEAIEGANQAAGVAAQAAAGASTASANANLAADNANASAGSAALAAKNANDAADNANHTAKSLMVIGAAKGNSIHLDGASDQFLVGMRIFGKTTQDGVPTPEAPVDLVSVGDDGNVGVTVAKKNLVDITKATPISTERIKVNGDTIVIEAGNGLYGVKLHGTVLEVGRTYTLSVGSVSQHGVNFGYRFFYDDGVSSDTLGDKSLVTITVTKPIKEVYFYVGYNFSVTSQIEVKQLQIELGSMATAYEPYSGRTLIASTPNGLPGIPVTTGGNYVDVDGQRWICDEIDLGRGMYIKRINTLVFDGSQTWAEYGGYPSYSGFHSTDVLEVNHSRDIGLCNQFAVGKLTDGNIWIGVGNKVIYVLSEEWHEKGVDAWNEHLRANPLRIIYPLTTPIETPLSEEELAAYAALRTYRENTTVSNDAGAWMDIEYVMDAKKYIDDMIHPVARLANVSLPASKWTGSGSLYSQVVYIDGITENSQVNLTPTVSQMTTFYEKDITFITENDGGVVTIYVIGQKPINDYVIPANIVEVRV